MLKKLGRVPFITSSDYSHGHSLSTHVATPSDPAITPGTLSLWFLLSLPHRRARAPCGVVQGAGIVSLGSWSRDTAARVSSADIQQ